MARSKQVLALAAAQVGHRRAVTPSQSRQNQNFAAIGQSWAALPPTSRVPWQLLANQMTHETGLRTPAGLKQKRPMHAYQAFAALNGTRLVCGMPLLTVAPAVLAQPDALPPVLLQASATPAPAETADPQADTAPAGTDTAATLPFTLTLSIPSYSNGVQIYAAPPLLVGQSPQSGAKAVIIATLYGFLYGPTDLAPYYAAKFGPLVPGQQVVLSLVAVSPQGFRGNPLSIAANVQSAAAQSAPRAQGDTDSNPLTLKTA